MRPFAGVGLPVDQLSELVLRAAEEAGFGVSVTRVAGARTRTVFVNDAACAIFRAPREALLERPPTEWLAAGELARLAATEAEIVERPLLREVRCVGPDGAVFTIELSAIGLDHGDERVVVAFFLDARERERAEAGRRAEQRRFRDVILGAPDGIVISRRGTILFANPAAAELLGVAGPDALVGRRFAEFLSPEDLQRMQARIAEGGRSRGPAEYRARRDDGGTVVVEVSSIPTEFEGEPAVLGFARDVTERARMREQMARADRLAAIGTLAAGVAHEVNNPLTFMTLGVGLLAARIEASSASDAERRAMLATLADVRSGAERVAAVVRELTAFSRQDDERACAVDPRAVVLSSVRIVSHRVRHVADVVVDLPALPPVLAHPLKLEQVFVNLILNASQAIEGAGGAGGAIRVTGRPVGADRVQVEVTDDGPGVPEELRARVFDPFFTTKPVGEGTGLGLSICHGIVANLGGTLELESAPGRTTFRVTLRRAEGEA